MLASPLNSGRQGIPVAKTSGFTLVELLTVIAIIMILAGIVVGVQRGVYSSQANAKARGEIQAIATALEQYKAAYGTYPRINNSPAELYQHLTGTRYSKYSGGSWSNMAVPGGQTKAFIDSSAMTVDNKASPTRFRDPWGSDYIYVYDPNPASSNDGFGEHFFILYSRGPDKNTTARSNDPANHASQSLYFGNAATADTSKDDIVFGLERN